MFPPEFIALIKHLLTSKEVIGVTVFLMLFFSLVFYAARTHPPKRKQSLVLPMKRPKKEKTPKAAAPKAMGDDDDLGIEYE